MKCDLYMWYFDMQNKNQNHTTLFHGKHMEAGSLQIPMILALEVWSSNITNKSFSRLLRGRRETFYYFKWLRWLEAIAFCFIHDDLSNSEY